MPQYNDYELIYLIKCEHCEYSLNLMFKKYTNLIYKLIHVYNVESKYREDYLQEGYILLNKAIDVFDESKGKTFTRFFEFILRRRILELKRKEERYELKDCLNCYCDLNPYYLEESYDLKNLTVFEKTVFTKHFLEHKQISEIALNENKSSKQIYNAIYRIKNKYKNNMI